MADTTVDAYLQRLDAAARVLPDDRRRELIDEITEHIAAARAAGAVGSEADLRTLLDRLGEPAEIVAAAQDDGDAAMPFGPGGSGPGWNEPGWSGPGWNGPGWNGPRGVRELRQPGIGREVGAVVLMTAGSIVPVVLWLAGVVLMWSSRRWRTWEKLLATLVFPGGPLLAVLVVGDVATSGGSCSATASTGAASAGASASSASTTGGSVQAGQVCHATHSSWGTPIVVTLIALWVLLPVIIGTVLVVRARNRAMTEPPIEVWRAPIGPGRWGPVEIAAVALLGVGGFIVPVIAPAVGIVCAWASSAWTTGEKWVATALAAIPLLLGVVLVLFAFAI